MCANKCKYCNTLLSHEIKFWSEQYDLKAYMCTTCNAEFVLNKDNTILTYSLYASIYNNKYRWTIGAAEEAYLFQVNEKNPGYSYRNFSLIKMFDKYSEITPDNAIEKISTIISFL